MSGRTAGVAGLVVTLLGAPADAQNRGPLPMGGRTGSMGGTAVAFGSDAAMPFLNPAGLARVPSHVFSLSLSAYSLDVFRYDDFFAQPEPPSLSGVNFDLSGNSLSSATVLSIPTALTYTIHVSDAPHQVLALSILIPHAERRELDGTLRLTNPFFTANDSFSLVKEEKTYFIGPSYAAQLGDSDLGIFFGASVFLAYTQRSVVFETEDVSGSVPPTDFAALQGSVFNSGKSYDLVGVVGLQVQAGAVSFGAAVQAPSLHVGGAFDLSSRFSRFGNGALDVPDVIIQRAGSGDFQERQPLRLAAGIALDLSSITLAADATVLLPLGEYAWLDGTAQTTTLQEGQQPQTVEEPVVSNTEEKVVINASLGFEYRVSDTLAVRAGVFTNFSSSRIEDPATTPLATEAIDRFGGSLGFGFMAGGTETALAIAYVGGIGDVVGLDVGNFDNESNQRLAPVLESTITVLLSGTVDLKSFLSGP